MVLPLKLQLKQNQRNTNNNVDLEMQFLLYIIALWNNYGLNKDNWTIDHIIPLSLAKVDENKQWLICQFNMMLMHYSNLQPMWLIDNIKKSNKIQ